MKLDKNTFYMTEDLFKDIIAEVKGSGKWPEDLIDYACPNSWRPAQIWNYEFDPAFVLKAGGSEGYYLDLAIQGSYGPKRGEIAAKALGTIKTLGESEDTVRRMAVLYGECLIAYEKIMREKLDDMTRIGFDIDCYIGETWAGGFSEFSKRKEAEVRAKELLAKKSDLTHVTIRDNLSRKITTILR